MQISIMFNPRQENFFLQQAETAIESHNRGDGRLWIPIPTHTSTTQLPQRRLRDHWGRGRQQDCNSQWIREFAVRPCPPEMSEAVPTKYRHHECLDMIQIRKTPRDKLTWKEGASAKALTPSFVGLYLTLLLASVTLFWAPTDVLFKGYWGMWWPLWSWEVTRILKSKRMHIRHEREGPLPVQI